MAGSPSNVRTHLPVAVWRPLVGRAVVSAAETKRLPCFILTLFLKRVSRFVSRIEIGKSGGLDDPVRPETWAFPIACTGREPEWMQVAFALPLPTDCRLRETRIPLNCLDSAENRITFPNPKAGEDRAFSIPMPSALKPTLERQKKERRRCTVGVPFQSSRRWQQLFIKTKMRHLCFRDLRVTFVNRLRRAVVLREVAMRLVNHCSELVHRIYQREKLEDVAQWRDAVRFPA